MMSEAQLIVAFNSLTDSHIGLDLTIENKGQEATFQFLNGFSLHTGREVWY